MLFYPCNHAIYWKSWYKYIKKNNKPKLPLCPRWKVQITEIKEIKFVREPKQK